MNANRNNACSGLYTMHDVLNMNSKFRQYEE